MYNLTYKIKENGYEIYKDGVLWISQYEPYIPNPSISYEENVIKHIEELNTPCEPNEDIETLSNKVEEQSDKISTLQLENNNLKQELSITQEALNELLFMVNNIKGE